MTQQRLLRPAMDQRSLNESACLQPELESHNRAAELRRTISAQRIHWPGKHVATLCCDLTEMISTQQQKAGKLHLYIFGCFSLFYSFLSFRKEYYKLLLAFFSQLYISIYLLFYVLFVQNIYYWKLMLYYKNKCSCEKTKVACDEKQIKPHKVKLALSGKREKMALKTY